MQGQALQDAYYLVSAGIRAASRNGYPTQRFEEIRRAIRAADMALRRHGDVVSIASQSDWGSDDESAVDPIDTAEAARILGLSLRSCQRLAHAGLGRRVGGRWVLDRGLVVAEAAARKESA